MGESTVEGYNSYGEVKSVTLPYSGFSFITSSHFFKLASGVREGQSIEPDIRVELMSADFAAGRDLVLERTPSGS